MIVSEGGESFFCFFFILGGVMCVWGRGGVLSLLVYEVEISSLCSCL